MSDGTLADLAERVNAAGIHAGDNEDAARRARNAGNALRALQAYATSELYGGESEFAHVVMADLLADMRYLCDLVDVGYDETDRRGERYYLGQ